MFCDFGHVGRVGMSREVHVYIIGGGGSIDWVPGVPTCVIRGAKKNLYGIRPFWEVGIRRIPWNTWNTSGIRA